MIARAFALFSLLLYGDNLSAWVWQATLIMFLAPTLSFFVAHELFSGLDDETRMMYSAGVAIAVVNLVISWDCFCWPSVSVLSVTLPRLPFDRFSSAS